MACWYLLTFRLFAQKQANRPWFRFTLIARWATLGNRICWTRSKAKLGRNFVWRPGSVLVLTPTPSRILFLVPCNGTDKGNSLLLPLKSYVDGRGLVVDPRSCWGCKKIRTKLSKKSRHSARGVLLVNSLTYRRTSSVFFERVLVRT